MKTFKVKSKPISQGSSLTLKFSKEGTPFYQLIPFGSQPTPSGSLKSSKTGVSSVSANDGDGDKRKEHLGCDWLHEVSITIRKVKTTSMPLEE